MNSELVSSLFVPWHIRHGDGNDQELEISGGNKNAFSKIPEICKDMKI